MRVRRTAAYSAFVFSLSWCALSLTGVGCEVLGTTTYVALEPGGAIYLRDRRLEDCGRPMFVVYRGIPKFVVLPSTGEEAQVASHRMPPTPAVSFVQIPGWIPCVTLFGISLLLYPRIRLQRGSRCGCGYDLTGLATPRCPECGSSVRLPDNAHRPSQHER